MKVNLNNSIIIQYLLTSQIRQNLAPQEIQILKNSFDLLLRFKNLIIFFLHILSIVLILLNWLKEHGFDIVYSFLYTHSDIDEWMDFWHLVNR